jgi:hypothetical protein
VTHKVPLEPRLVVPRRLVVAERAHWVLATTAIQHLHEFELIEGAFQLVEWGYLIRIKRKLVGLAAVPAIESRRRIRY